MVLMHKAVGFEESLEHFLKHYVRDYLEVSFRSSSSLTNELREDHIYLDL